MVSQTASQSVIYGSLVGWSVCQLICWSVIYSITQSFCQSTTAFFCKTASYSTRLHSHFYHFVKRTQVSYWVRNKAVALHWKETLSHVTGSDSQYPNLNPAQYVRTLFLAIISGATTLRSIPLPLSLANWLCACYNWVHLITDQIRYIVFSVSFLICVYSYANFHWPWSNFHALLISLHLEKNHWISGI